MSGTLDFYPEKPDDPAEALLKDMATRRMTAGKTLALPILDFHAFKAYLEKELADEVKKQARLTEVAPFIREIHIWGHGKPGYFKFGRELIGAENLKKLGTGTLGRYVKPETTIYLKGCNAAAGDQGKAFMYQLGRIIFGGKTGYLWGNRRPVISLMGVDQSQGDPVKYKYPTDFKQLAK